jgi:hypothetical protein
MLKTNSNNFIGNNDSNYYDNKREKKFITFHNKDNKRDSYQDNKICMNIHFEKNNNINNNHSIINNNINIQNKIDDDNNNIIKCNNNKDKRRTFKGSSVKRSS